MRRPEIPELMGTQHIPRAPLFQGSLHKQLTFLASWPCRAWALYKICAGPSKERISANLLFQGTSLLHSVNQF